MSARCMRRRLARWTRFGRSAPSGDEEYANHVDVKQAERFASYIHLADTTGHRRQGDLGQPRPGGRPELATPAPTSATSICISRSATSPIGWKGSSRFRSPSATTRSTPVARPRGTRVARGVHQRRHHPQSGHAQIRGACRSVQSSVVHEAPIRSTWWPPIRRGRIWIARWTPNRYVRNWDRWRPCCRNLGATPAPSLLLPVHTPRYRLDACHQYNPHGRME